MKLHFLGANRQVTGSRYMLEVADKQILIDCGMFQERNFLGRNWEPSIIPPSAIDALLLTHAHLDHCGLIPRLVREGYRGPIYSTPATVPLAELVMQDSAEIQAEDVAYKKKRHAREGRTGPHPEEVLYRVEDVAETMKLFRGVRYGQATRITDAVTATFFDAGHMLGSAMIEFQVQENGATRKVLFSGDIGQWQKPIIRDPTLFSNADYVVMESTYGDRTHEDMGDIEGQLRQIIEDTVAKGGNVVIPTFAIERAQELLYYLGKLVHANQIPDLPIYLDSPMSVDATEIFRRFPECFDADMWQLIQSNRAPFRFAGLRMARTADESKAINRTPGPAVIMSSSGMCTSGRIKHHLRQNIERPECTILFVGYQSQGTLGRQILDGNPRVRIHGQMFRVRARTAQIYGFSGHADRDGLIRWLSALKSPPRQVFLTHGEESAANNFARYVQDTMKWPVTVPEYRTVVDLQ